MNDNERQKLRDRLDRYEVDNDESLVFVFIDALLTSARAEATNAALARAADSIRPAEHYAVRCTGTSCAYCELSRASDRILALADDPNWAERERLKARIEEARWWHKREHWVSGVPCDGSLKGVPCVGSLKSCERHAELESQLFALTPKDRKAQQP